MREQARRLVAVATVAAAVAVGATAVPARAAMYVGSAARVPLHVPIVGMAATASGHGYWLVTGDGNVFAYGDARFAGSLRGRRLNQPIIDIAATPSDRGYWLVASDGGVFTFGDARFYGSTGGRRLTKPVVGIAATATGHGYRLVASDGGVFTFGDARFYGSTGGRRLTKPVVGIAATATGSGYWLVASDGGVFTFGDARFYGSTGNRRLAAPIVGMSKPRLGGGYWLLGRDGGVFSFGTARFYGSANGVLLGQAAVRIAASPKNDGYWIASQWGAVATGSPDGMHIDPNLLPNAKERAIASELVQRINAERIARGRVALAVDPLLASTAAAWARHLAMTQTFAHSDLGALLRRANGRFIEVGENLFAASGNGVMDAGTAHVAFMHSDGHRADILLPESRYVGVGAACLNGEMVIVEDFAVPSGITLGSHPIPPPNPIAAPDEAGASC